MKNRIWFVARITAVALTAVILLGGCGDSATTDSQPTTSPTSDGPQAPSWQAKYSLAELEAYRASLVRYQSYEQTSEPIWAAGQATAPAKQLLQEFFIPWQSQWALLKQYAAAGIRTEGLPKVLSSRATRIKIDSKSADVVIEQCVDFTTAKVTQEAKAIAPVTTKPQLRDVDMNLVDGKWMIFKVTNAEGGNRPCGG